MNIYPRECTPVEETPAFEIILRQVERAVHNMQFGDILWIQIQRGDQSATAKTIAGLIYNNLPEWSKLLRDDTHK